MLQGLFEGCLHVNCALQNDESNADTSVLPACKGVVLFCDENDTAIQLLITGNIRRLVRSRLSCDDVSAVSRRADIASIVRRVWYLSCHNDFRTAVRHMQIAKQVYPDSWHDVVSLPAIWFVRINTAEQWPNVVSSTRAAGGHEQRSFGPFASRKSADRFVESLRLAFGLCRRPDIVDVPEKAASCPYLQMNTCPAPCVGNMDRQEYMQQVCHALEAAGGAFDIHAERLRVLMKELASQMRFEQANALKKRTEALEVLKKDEYRWTTDMSRLAILHIDRSAKAAPEKGKRRIQTYAGFLITAGRVVEFEDFAIADIERFCESLRKCLKQPAPAEGNITETMSLAGYFLYRSSRSGIWIDCSAGEDGCWAADRLLDAMVEKWGLGAAGGQKKEDACE
jgi:hypothetical protein